MRDVIVAILFLCFSNVAFAQRITFDYDENGNRVLREVDLPKPNITIEEENDISPKDISEDNDDIKIYPNPFKNILYVE